MPVKAPGAAARGWEVIGEDCVTLTPFPVFTIELISSSNPAYQITTLMNLQQHSHLVNPIRERAKSKSITFGLGDRRRSPFGNFRDSAGVKESLVLHTHTHYALQIHPSHPSSQISDLQLRRFLGIRLENKSSIFHEQVPSVRG